MYFCRLLLLSRKWNISNSTNSQATLTITAQRRPKTASLQFDLHIILRELIKVRRWYRLFEILALVRKITRAGLYLFRVPVDLHATTTAEVLKQNAISVMCTNF